MGFFYAVLDTGGVYPGRSLARTELRLKLLRMFTVHITSPMIQPLHHLDEFSVRLLHYNETQTKSLQNPRCRLLSNIVKLSNLHETDSTSGGVCKYRYLIGQLHLSIKIVGRVNSSSTVKKALTAYRKQNKIKGDDEDTGESVLAGVDISDPVFYCSIEAPSSSKQLLMEKALEKLQREDPSLHVDVNTETQEMIISWMRELHIDIVKNRLEKEHGIEISYKEIITKSVEETLRFENTFGKTNSSVEITMRVQPDDSSKLFKKAEFSEDLVIACYHKKAINEGIKSALNYGPVFRCPVLNVAVDILDFKILKRSNDRFVKAETYECTTQALQNALPQLVEPIMALQVSSD